MKAAIFLLAVLVAAVQAKLKEYDGVLSDEDHFADEHHDDDEHHEHNSKYDHEAFLGKDESKHFDELTPEESKAKLGEIYDKIDTNRDGQVTADELKAWMEKAQHRYAETDAVENMKLSDKDKDSKLTFDEFKATSYGFLKPDGDLKEVFDPDEFPKFHKDELDKKYYTKQVARDERRFKLADKNADGALDATELPGFLHPETAEHMRIISAYETIEDMDKDKDAHISLDEFVDDLQGQDGQDKQKKKGEEEPEWLRDEKKNFTEVHDLNKDGKLDAEEVKKWIFPTEEDYLGDEAKHLIKEADANNDGNLSKDEMLNKQDIFVGSQATDFGDMLHDEPKEEL